MTPSIVRFQTLTKREREDKEIRLLNILRKLDVPSHRLIHRDYRWMIRNLGSYNGNRKHPEFREAISILVDLA